MESHCNQELCEGCLGRVELCTKEVFSVLKSIQTKIQSLGCMVILGELHSEHVLNLFNKISYTSDSSQDNKYFYQVQENYAPGSILVGMMIVAYAFKTKQPWKIDPVIKYLTIPAKQGLLTQSAGYFVLITIGLTEYLKGNNAPLKEIYMKSISMGNSLSVTALQILNGIPNPQLSLPPLSNAAIIPVSPSVLIQN